MVGLTLGLCSQCSKSRPNAVRITASVARFGSTSPSGPKWCRNSRRSSIGLAAGLGLTFGAAPLLRWCTRLGWANEIWKQVTMVALAVACFAVAQSLHGTGEESAGKLFLGWFGHRAGATHVPKQPTIIQAVGAVRSHHAPLGRRPLNARWVGAFKRACHSRSNSQAIFPLRMSGRLRVPGGVPLRMSSIRSALTRGLLSK